MERPPCPTCEGIEPVVAHGFRTVDGTRRRSFRCRACAATFTPGSTTRVADASVRAAARRVRNEAEVPYRLLARALTQHLGIAVSHTAVRNWCAEDVQDEPVGTPCAYLSLLWALRQEITRDVARE